MKSVIALLIFISGSYAAPAQKSDDCAYCSDLKAIDESLRHPKEKKPDYDALQLAATVIIQKMIDSKNHLTDKQVSQVVRVMDASIARDPARAIVENNSDIVKANRASFDREIKKLPGANQEAFKSAIQSAIGHENPTTGFEDKK